MNILICICSSNRPHLLDNTLKSFSNIFIPANVNLFIQIIDNNIFRNNKLIYEKYKKNKKFNLYYSTELKKGIVHARNKFLNNIRYLAVNINYIGFIDDDCRVDKGWLKNHLTTFKKINCDISTGPQKIKKSTKHIEQMYYLMNKKIKNDLTKTNWAATNNVILKYSILKKEKLEFDINLNEVGGSDQLFFSILSRKGAHIIWNNNACVIENLKFKKMNEKWFFKRNIRYGYSNSYMNKIIYGNFNGFFMSTLKYFYLVTQMFKVFIFKNYYKNNYLYDMYKFRAQGLLRYYFGKKVKKYY